MGPASPSVAAFSPASPDPLAPAAAAPSAGPPPEASAPAGATAAPEPALPRAVDCVAVIYAPGLFEKEDGRSLAHFAERLARALDQQDAEEGRRFAARPALVETHGPETPGRAVEVREIVRAAPDGRREVSHRIFYLDYETELVAARTEGNVLTEALALGSTCFRMTGLYLLALPRARSLGANKKAATALAGAALAALAVVFLLVLSEALAAVKVDVVWPAFSWAWFWAGLQEVAGHLEPLTRRLGGDYVNAAAVWVFGLGAAAAGWIWGGVEELWGWLTQANAWLLAAGVLAVKRWRVEVARAVDMFLMTSRYLLAGRGRAKCTGRFNDLLEHVVESGARRIDVVGYSMGSLVALDALFPWEGTPTGRGARVRTLTTIGCPFDFVRSFWPDYFDGREVDGAPSRWVNVYSPVDLLGSNFANTEGPASEAVRGINASDPMSPQGAAGAGPAGAGERPEARPTKNLLYDHLNRRRLSWRAAMTGEAFAAHSQYWVRGSPGAESCLRRVVAELYGPEVAKRGAGATGGA